MMGKAKKFMVDIKTAIQSSNNISQQIQGLEIVIFKNTESCGCEALLLLFDPVH